MTKLLNVVVAVFGCLLAYTLLTNEPPATAQERYAYETRVFRPSRYSDITDSTYVINATANDSTRAFVPYKYNALNVVFTSGGTVNVRVRVWAGNTYVYGSEIIWAAVDSFDVAAVGRYNKSLTIPVSSKAMIEFDGITGNHASTAADTVIIAQSW